MKKVITKNDKVYLQVLIPRELYENLLGKLLANTVGLREFFLTWLRRLWENI